FHSHLYPSSLFSCFIFCYTPHSTPQIYTLSLHDALPILPAVLCRSRSLPPEERKLPDVFAGRHHQRTPREHAGFAHGVLELRKLCELVARLGPNVLSPAGDASKHLRLRGW